MATDAYSTGAPSRAPTSNQIDVPLEVANLHSLITQTGAVLYGLEAVLADFGAVPDEDQRRRVDAIASLHEVIAGIMGQAERVCDDVETGVRLLRVGR